MTFLNNIAFWGLIGLLLPIGIHLLSKKKKNTVFFSSLEFLQPSESQSVKSIRLTQIALLLLRLSLLTLIVLLIAQPVIVTQKKSKISYIEKDLINNQDFIKTYESGFINSGIIYYTTQKDKFDNETIYIPSLWSLVQKANRSADSIVIYSMNKMEDFSGTAIALNSRVKWISFPIKYPFAHQDTLTKNGTSIPIELITSEYDLKAIEKEPQRGLEVNDTVSFRIVGSKASSNASEKLADLIKAIADELPVHLELTTAMESDWTIATDSIIPIPENQNHITYHPTNDKLSFTRLGPNIFQLEGQIDVENLMESQFADQLSSIVLNKHTDLENKYNIQMSQSLIPRTEKAVLHADAAHSRQPKTYKWLWIIALILLGLERYFSTRKTSNN